jgi:YcxB-like protein
MTDVLSIRVTPDRDDYYVWHREASQDIRQRRSYKCFSWICAAVALVVALAARAGASGESGTSREVALDLLFVAGFFGVWYFLAFVLSPLFQRFFNPVPDRFLSPYEMRLDQNGLHIAGEYGESMIAWRAISDVKENSAYIFLRRGGAVWLVIAKRNIEASPNFVQTVRAYLAKQGQ